MYFTTATRETDEIVVSSIKIFYIDETAEVPLNEEIKKKKTWNCTSKTLLDNDSIMSVNVINLKSKFINTISSNSNDIFLQKIFFYRILQKICLN